MFYELYKKHIQIGIVLLLILGIFWSLFYINSKDARVIDSIHIDVSSWSVKFEDSKLSWTQEKYDYYQVYLYPNIFEITCISAKKEVCDKIEKAKDSLKTNIIWFIGRDLTKWAYWEVELKTYLEWDTIDNKKLKDLFIQLYNNNGFQGLKKLEGEMVKYFDYKREENPNEEVMVNNFEMSCFEKIRSTIPLWSFDEENLIKNPGLVNPGCL